MSLEEMCDIAYKLAAFIWCFFMINYNDDVGHYMQQTPLSANKSTSKTLQQMCFLIMHSECSKIIHLVVAMETNGMLFLSFLI